MEFDSLSISSVTVSSPRSLNSSTSRRPRVINVQAKKSASESSGSTLDEVAPNTPSPDSHSQIKIHEVLMLPWNERESQENSYVFRVCSG